MKPMAKRNPTKYPLRRRWLIYYPLVFWSAVIAAILIIKNAPL